jgi:hypothetical protein
MVDSYVNVLLLVSGLATCSAILQFLAPARLTQKLFDVDVTQPAVLMLSRHWSLLAFLIGCLLLSGIVYPMMIPAAMIIAGTEKVVFAALLLFSGAKRTPVRWGFAVSDALFAVLFALYLSTH